MDSTAYFAGDERRARIWANMLWVPALLVGALQMFHVRAGVLTSYGADVFGPLALYVSSRANGTIFRRFLHRPLNPVVSATMVLAACVAWECCQLFDLSGTPLAITRGRFDPFDIVAYVVGVGVGMVLDKVTATR